MSEQSPSYGRGGKPAANQIETEAMPADESQSTPSSGNLAGADPQAPAFVAQSAAGGGVPRAQTAPRGAVPGRPGSAEPDQADDSHPVTGDGGAAGATGHGTGPSGEVST